MGRPIDPKVGRRSKTVKLRMSELEYRRLVAKAKAKGLSLSEFLRDSGKD
jgi:hypothetical protein